MLKLLNFDEKSEIYKEVNLKIMLGAYRYQLKCIKEDPNLLPNITEILQDEELPLFIQEMIKMEMKSEANYICQKRGLPVLENVAPMVFPEDDKTQYLDLECQNIHFITCVQDIEKLDILKTEKYIGVDSEWIINISPLSKPKPALL